MNHGNSGLAHGTSGSPQLTLENGEMAEKANELALKEIKNTSEVWKHIEATHPNYAGTPIPRSFTIDTPAGKMWTHGNATEHMYEAMIATKATAPKLLNSNPNLYSQFILYDYWKTLGKAVSNGIQYEKIQTIGRWELIFSKPRKEGDKPVVKHSKFLGL